VVAGIDRKCRAGNSCEIVLSDYTNFNWHVLYVFPSSASAADIAGVLGKELPDYREMSVHEVFMYKGQIIRHEQALPDIERPPKNGLVIDFPHGVEPVRYKPHEIVRAAIKTDYSYKFYLLSPQ
jgi:hypothetical protein